MQRLSDSFPSRTDHAKSDVEVRVHIFNIRPQRNSELLNGCKSLAEYSWFVEGVRKNHETMELEPAVDKAIKDMPEDFEIKEFLIEHQSEVKNMCITEYNEAETMELFKEEGREEGREQTLIILVCRKLRKGKQLKQIAEDLEEDESSLKSIFEVASGFAPDYDEQKVIAAVRKKEMA